MTAFTAGEQTLIDVWEAHTAAEFERKDADAALAVMTDHPALIHVPVGTGATGRDALRRFYAEVFIPQIPPDLALQLLTRTVNFEQGMLIDEFIIRFTHTIRMEWLAPGIAPTGRTVAIPHVAVIAFEDRKIKSEHIYWDQGTLLRQLGAIEADLPVLGTDAPDRLLAENAPANILIERFSE